MSAPEKIVRKDDLTKPVLYAVGNEDGEMVHDECIGYFLTNKTYTQYTRSDLVEALVKAAEDLLSVCNHIGTFSNGVSEYGGFDEGDVMAGKAMDNLSQAIKALEDETNG